MSKPVKIREIGITKDSAIENLVLPLKWDLKVSYYSSI